MDFKTFNDLICSQIDVPCTAEFGDHGTGYLKVLTFDNGEFKELGELLYDIWHKGLYTEQDLIAFGKECEYYRIGFSKTMPTWCYKGDSKLTFY